MGKYMLFFVGGNIPDDRMEQSITDRVHWMDGLKQRDAFVTGSPLSRDGKVIVSAQDVQDFRHEADSVNGFAIIEAANLDEAVAIAKEAPQMLPEYGAAQAVVRELNPLL